MIDTQLCLGRRPVRYIDASQLTFAYATQDIAKAEFARGAVVEP